MLSLNNYVIEDLKWWLGAIPNAKNNINTPQVDFMIVTTIAYVNNIVSDSCNYLLKTEWY